MQRVVHCIAFNSNKSRVSRTTLSYLIGDGEVLVLYPGHDKRDVVLSVAEVFHSDGALEYHVLLCLVEWRHHSGTVDQEYPVHEGHVLPTP